MQLTNDCLTCFQLLVMASLFGQAVTTFSPRTETLEVSPNFTVPFRLVQRHSRVDRFDEQSVV